MYTIKNLLFCGCSILVLTTLFLYLCTFPFSPFSFASVKIGKFVSSTDNSPFVSNRFFYGIVFVFRNLQKDEINATIRIIHTSDNTEYFNKNILFSKEQKQSHLKPYKANPISLESNEFVKISKVLHTSIFSKHDVDISTTTSFLLLLPNTGIFNGSFKVVAEFGEETGSFDCCYYAPYFLVYRRMNR